jgi:signal transduction histidine kinase
MVADEGVGISPGNQDYVFDKFYRVDSTNTAVPGLGIGLYLVKKIIEAHRGKVWIESVLGKRTKFTFTLPLRSN